MLDTGYGRQRIGLPGQGERGDARAAVREARARPHSILHHGWPRKFGKVSAAHHLILVLWGQGFDEIAAAIFVAELRRLGKRVKLVGLHSRQAIGQHGVKLVPDLPLGQALQCALTAQCVIVPAPLAALQQFSYDPRLAELLEIAVRNEALFVVNAVPSPEAHPSSTSLPPASSCPTLVYPPGEALLAFVQVVLAPQLV